jgi:hypothetical protein
MPLDTTVHNPSTKLSCTAAWGSGGIAPNILDLGTGWRWVVSFTPRGFSLRYPLDRRLVVPQSQSEFCGNERSLLPLPGTKPWFLNYLACRLVPTPTELTRLQSIYSYSRKITPVPRMRRLVQTEVIRMSFINVIQCTRQNSVRHKQITTEAIPKTVAQVLSVTPSAVV